MPEGPASGERFRAVDLLGESAEKLQRSTEAESDWGQQLPIAVAKRQHPQVQRPATNPLSGAHAKVSPALEDFLEPDPEFVASLDESSSSRAERLAATLRERDRTIAELERRVSALEAELAAARSVATPSPAPAAELQATATPSPVASVVPNAETALAGSTAQAGLAPLRSEVSALSREFAAPIPPESVAPRESEQVGAGYPVLSNIAVALSASSLPPRSADSTPPSQRRAQRKVCALELEFTEETHFYAGLTQDISEGGVFIATYHLFPVGTRLELSFQLPDGTLIKTCGRVRWLRGDAAQGERPGMGVAFGDLAEDALSAIARYCQERPPLYMEI
jgi:uncharacterized protein (TIGR02266 family)